jgi:phosphoglycerate dehydrogenase-like enzyme
VTEIRRALLALRWRADLQDALAAELAPARVDHVDLRNGRAVAGALAHCDVAFIAGNADARFLQASQLRWVHCDHAGVDGYAPAALLERTIVTTSAGRSAPALAEHAMYLLLALCEQASRVSRAQRWRVWRVSGLDERRALFGRRVCIVGTGHTGIEVARRCRAFGMQVIGYRRRDDEADPAFEKVYAHARGDRLVDALAGSDVLVIAAGLNNGSRHLVGAEEFDALTRGALLVNVGRGGVVDEHALFRALQSGQVGGAGLDVFETEPLSVTSPLWGLRNVVVTPHATPRMPDRDARSFEIVRDNVRRYRAGEPLVNALTAADAYEPSAPAPPRGLERRVTRVWNIANRLRRWG